MEEWDVWLAEFPYEEDSNIAKQRPVIILNIDNTNEQLEVLSIKVTHHGIRDSDEYDIPIAKWREAGLKNPSVARVSKTIMLTEDKFIHKFGVLNVEDIEVIYYKYIDMVK